MDDLSSLSLADIARLAEARKLPPVAQWHPAHCGDSAMRIARDGTWYHEGSPIGRPEMVRLFSTILRREPDGGFVLVTPAEKLDIEVEDAPFVAVELKSEGEGEGRRLAFRLNTGDLVIAGPATTGSPVLRRKASRRALPSPSLFSSTATKGASSTWISSFSAGVTRTKPPSGSRLRMVENRRTMAGRPIGLP